MNLKLKLALPFATSDRMLMLITGDNSEDICFVATEVYEKTKQNLDELRQQHNELLAALKLCIAELEAYDLPSDTLHPQNVAVTQARAAIARARG